MVYLSGEFDLQLSSMRFLFLRGAASEDSVEDVMVSLGSSCAGSSIEIGTTICDAFSLLLPYN